MKLLLQKLLLLLKRVLSRFPSKLPVGVTEYKKFEADVIELAGPMADQTSMSFAIASILIHAPSEVGSLPKSYFVLRLRKSAANQVASQVFQDIKTAQEAAKQTPKAEVTAVTPTEVTPANAVASETPKP